MRTVVINRSAEEMKDCNITVWQMLRAIQMLVTLSRTGRLDTACKVLFTFTKEKGVRHFNGTATFWEKESGRPIRTQPDLGSSLVFIVPEGESVKDSFEWLCSEVIKLAYAMTNGEIGQDFCWPLPHFDTSVDNRAISTTIKMEFVQLGPDISLITAALSPNERGARHPADWFNRK